MPLRDSRHASAVPLRKPPDGRLVCELDGELCTLDPLTGRGPQRLTDTSDTQSRGDSLSKRVDPAE